MTAIEYEVKPRYSNVPAARVTRNDAIRYAQAELDAYASALRGELGGTKQHEARTQGVRGIILSIHVEPDGTRRTIDVIQLFRQLHA